MNYKYTIHNTELIVHKRQKTKDKTLYNNYLFITILHYVEYTSMGTTDPANPDSALQTL